MINPGNDRRGALAGQIVRLRATPADAAWSKFDPKRDSVTVTADDHGVQPEFVVIAGSDLIPRLGDSNRENPSEHAAITVPMT